MEPHSETNRRAFLRQAGAASLSVLVPRFALAAANPYERLLILVELKGGNDGLNTVVPYADPTYAALRPNIGIARDAVLPISETAAFHPSLEALMPLWRDGRLAVLQGVGYPQPNLSHFRSIEIWDTASASDEVLTSGWLARTFAAKPVPASWAADAMVLGSSDMGPLAGAQRAVVLGGAERGAGGSGDMTEQFMQRAQSLKGLAEEHSDGNAPSALRHIQQVEEEVRLAGERLAVGTRPLATTFPASAFGNTVHSACDVLASRAGVAALRLTLSGFDTHQNQTGIQAGLLRQLADGFVALRQGLEELGLWDKTLVLTYAEFGRRAAENRSRGTDHGTANVHFAFGGAVRGGLYGEAPALNRLDGNGNVPFFIDFRNVYATVLERWWTMNSREVLRGHFPSVGFLA